jgi:hypothetical protein
MILTHSSYWLERNQAQQNEKLKADEKKNETSDKSPGDAGKENETKTELAEVRAGICFR